MADWSACEALPAGPRRGSQMARARALFLAIVKSIYRQLHLCMSSQVYGLRIPWSGRSPAALRLPQITLSICLYGCKCPSHLASSLGKGLWGGLYFEAP